MDRWIRAMVIAVVVTTGTVRLTASADGPAARAESVRGASDRGGSLVRDGVRRSETVRGLVAALDRSDVLVYVDVRYVAHGPAGATGILAVNTKVRVLAVRVSPMLDANRALEILAHELQHCVEIAGDPSVRNADSLRAHSLIVGWATDTSHDHFETEAADAAERLVRCDLAGRPCAAGAMRR